MKESSSDFESKAAEFSADLLIRSSSIKSLLRFRVKSEKPDRISAMLSPSTSLIFEKVVSTFERLSLGALCLELISRVGLGEHESKVESERHR